MAYPEKDVDPTVPEKKAVTPGLGTVDTPAAANLTQEQRPGLEIGTGRWGNAKVEPPAPDTSLSLNPKSDEFVLGDTLAGDIARAAYDVPIQLKGATAGFIEGREDPMAEIDWKDEAIEKANLRTQRRMEFQFRKDNRVREEVRKLPGNLAFSGVSMALGLGAGIGGSAVGGPVAGYGLGMGAAGYGAYNMEANMFGRELHEAANADYMEKNAGQPIPDSVWAEKFKQLQPYITKDALAEALPEAVGSAVGFRILRGPSQAIARKVLGDKVMDNVAKNMSKYATGAVGAVFKGASMFAEEEATEVVTQMLQHNIAIDAGLSDAPKRSWLNPEDVWTSAKEVAPQVALLTGVMGGGGAIINRAYKKGVEDPRFLNDVNAVVAEDKLHLMPKKVLDQTIQMAEEAQRRHKKDPAFKTNVDILKAEAQRRQSAAEAAGQPGYGPDQAPPGATEAPTTPPPTEPTPETPPAAGEPVTPPGPELPPETPPQTETPPAAAPATEIPRNFKEPKTLPGIKVTEAYREADEAIAKGEYDKLGEIAAGMEEYSTQAKSNRVKEQAKDAATQIRAFKIPEGTTQQPAETPPGRDEEITPVTEPKPEDTTTPVEEPGEPTTPEVEQPETTPPETEPVTPETETTPPETTPPTEETPETPEETTETTEETPVTPPELETKEEQETPVTDDQIDEVTDDDIEKMFQDAEEEVQAAADEAATSDTNDKTPPTPEQLESGDYEKGEIPPELVNSHKILIENPAGSVRKGTDQDGETWEQTMEDNYGYFDKTEAADGDAVDVFVGPRAVDPGQDVYVVNQVDPKTGEFDEHKVMYGYESEEAAKEAYNRNYEKGWQGMGEVDTYTQVDFKEKLESGFFKNSTLERQGKKEPKYTPEQEAEMSAPPTEERVVSEPREYLHFENKAVEKEVKQNFKSREIMVEMTPQEFLEVAAEGVDQTKTETVNKIIAEGKEFNTVPTLKFENEGGGAAKVFGHEGRHRARKLIELGVNKMPVLLQSVEGGKAGAIRWGSQEEGSSDRLDIKDFPTLLTGQGKKTNTIPFPVKTKDVGLVESGVTPPENEVTTKKDQKVFEPFDKFYSRWVEGSLPPRNESDVAYVVQGFKGEPHIWDTPPGKSGLVGKKTTLKEAIRQRYDWILKENNLNEPVIPETKPETETTTTKKPATEQKESLVEASKKALDAKVIFGAVKGVKVKPYKDGWVHAVEGGTMSNMADVSDAKKEGYEAAIAWMKEKGYKAKIETTFEDTGAVLRRIQDGIKSNVNQADNKLVELYKQTNRQNLLPDIVAHDKATPGVRHLLWDIRNGILPFKEWAGEELGGGRRYYQSSFSEAIDEAFTDDPQRVLGLAEKYAKELAAIGELFYNEPALEPLLKKIDKKWFKTEEKTSYGGKKYQQTTDTQDGALAGQVMRKGTWRYRWDAAKSRLKTENDPFDPTSQRKIPMKRPKMDSIQRSGFKTDRNGRNVDAKEIRETFGLNNMDGKLTDVTLGKYVKKDKKSAQDHMNYAYDALHDLAETLGIKPKDIGMGGYWHLSIGALGRGHHAAHFNPGHPVDLEDGTTASTPVINVTKGKGDGSLAHEWGHALDYKLRNSNPAGVTHVVGQLKRQALVFDKVMEDVQRFITGGWRYPHLNKKREGGTKPWHVHALHHVKYRLKMADDTQYYKNAKKMDKSKAGKMDAYWSNDQELFARAFEGYVFDIMSGESNYLVNEWVEAGQIAPPRYTGQPYPAEEDRTLAKDNMELLLKAIEWTKDGPVLSKDWKAPKVSYDADAMKKKVIAKIEEIQQEQEKEKKQKEDDAEIGLTGGTDLAKSFYRAIHNGEMPKDNREVKKIVAEFDGVDPKDIDYARLKTAQEDLEAALVMRGRWIMDQIVNHRKRYGNDEMSDREAFNALRNLYESQPLLNIQSTDSKSRQAFSTPLPMAFIASRLAGVTRQSSTYEPTAGNGVLLIDANHKESLANELDQGRGNALRSMFGKLKVWRRNAASDEMLSTLDNPRGGNEGEFDSVIMNPPFGKMDENVDFDGYEISKIDHLIAAHALKLMNKDGKAVLIIGANKKAGSITNADRVFFNWLYSNYKVTQHFEVSGDLYKRQGAAWPVRMIVVEGRQESKTFSPIDGDIKRLDSYEKLYKTFAAIRDGKDVVSAIEGKSGQTDATGRQDTGETEGTDTGRVPGEGVVEPGTTGIGGTGTTGPGGTTGRGPGGRSDTGRPDVTGDTDTGTDTGVDTGGRGRTAPGEQGGTGVGTEQTETTVPEADAGLAPDADISIEDDEFDQIWADLETEQEVKVETKVEYPKTNEVVGPHRIIYNVMPDTNAGTRKKAKKKKAKEKTAGEHLQEAGGHALKGANAALDGLAELFGGGSTLKSFPAFDEETYQKALPAFEESIEEFKKAAKSANEAWAMFIKAAVKKYGMVIKPYVLRFRNEYHNKDKGLQATYSGMSKSPSGVVLTPVNQASATFKILKNLEDTYGSVDEFVRKELEYDSIEQMHGEQGSNLAGLQIDGLALAIHQIKTGGALIIGDQTGVGKGRQAAGMVRWARINGYTPVFVTAKPDLYTDMHEELLAIGETGIRPFISGNTKGHWIVDHENNNELIFRNTKDYRKHVNHIIENGTLPEDRNAYFTTYDQLNSKGDRATPKRDMLGVLADNAVFILDESHKAAGNNPQAVSHRGEFMRSMLERSGRAVYLSATYAKRPDNMPLYFLTDLSKAANSMDDLVAAINAGGVPMMEIISTQLTANGQFIRRERSFEGIDMKMVVDPEKDDHSAEAEELRKRAINASDETTLRLRQIILADRAFNSVIPDIRRRMLTEMGVDVRPGGNQAGASVNHASFTSVIHNAISQMLVSIKADRAADRAIEDIKAGKRPVIAVDKTMGSFLDDHAKWLGANNGDELPGFDYRVVLSRALRRTRYVSVKESRNQTKPTRVEIPISDLPPAIQQIYNTTQELINELDLEIPASPLDRIRYRLEQAGYSVAEITGRTKIAKYHEDGSVTLDTKPIRERNDRVGIVKAFNDGEIDAILANRSAAEGISMHSSPKFKPPKGQWPRKMSVVDASADIAVFMQMLGRINRTGQVVVPEYEIYTTPLMAEKRPAAVLLAKLKKLSANTSSNEKSSSTFEAVDLINKYGDEIIARYLDDNPETRRFMDVDYNLSSDPIQVADVAQTVTGQMAVMPHHIQQEFYDRVVPEYNQYIAYLDSISKNELKAKTHKLDAELIEDPTILHQGDDQTSMFTANAILGKYSVARETKIPAPAEVQHELDTELGKTEEEPNGKTPSEYMNALIEPAEEAHAPMVEEHIARLEKAYSEIKDDNPDKSAAAGGHQPIAQPQTGAGRAYNARWNMLEKLKDTRKEVTQRLMRRYKIGYSVNLDLGDGEVQGVVMGVKHEWNEGEMGNPFAKSRWKVDIRINGYTGRINQPLSRLEVIDPLPYEGKEDYIGHRASIGRIFEQTIENTSGRDIRYIVTGNIIAAHRNLNRRGEIAHFTLKGQKNPIDGIIMPRDFDPAVDINQETVFRDPATAYRFLKDNWQDDVVSGYGLKTGDVSLRAMPVNAQGDIELRAKGQGIGNKWWQNTEFVDLIGGPPEGFVGNKEKKTITVPAANVPAVFEYIYRTSPFYALQSMKGKAEPYVTDVDLNAPRFAVGSKATGKLGVRKIKDHAERLMSDWGNRPHTRIVRTESVLPDDIQAHIKKVGAEGTVEGVYWKGSAYVVADKMQDMDHVERTIFEEVLGHHGLRSTLGPKFVPIMNEVWLKYGKRGTADVIKRYFTGDNQFDVNNRDHRLLAAEEKLTDMIQEKTVPPNMWQKIVAAVRSWWRENVFSLKMTDNDIKVLLQNAKDFVKNGNIVKSETVAESPAVYKRSQEESGYAPDMPMFSRSPKYATYEPEVQDAKDKAKFGRGDVDNVMLRALGRARDAIDEGSQVWKTRLRQGMLDQYDSLRTTLDNPRAWMMANLSHSAGGAVEAMLKYGRIYMKQGAIGVDVRKKSVAEIFEPLGDEVADFMQWVAANRANSLIREGKEALLSQDQIDALLTLSNSDRVSGTSLDGKDREAIYKEAAEQFALMNDAVVQIGVETGTVNDKDAEIWREQGFYVPFYRLIEKEGTTGGGFMSVSGLVNQTPYKPIKGADIPLNDLLTNTIMNWNHVLSASLKNQAAVETIETAMEMGLATPANPKFHSKQAIFVRMDGKKKWFELDKSSEGQLVLDSLMSLNWRGLDNFTMKAARKFKRALTMGVTASPEFKVANLLRDSIQAIAVAKMDTKIYKNLKQGWLATGKNSEIIAQMIAGGGAFGDSGYVHGSDQEALNKVVQDDVHALERVLDSSNKIKKMWHIWQDFGARMENVNRAANFEQDISRNVDLLSANFNARDHLDFMRTGSFVAVRALTQVIPFLNARMQGLDKLARASRDKNQQRQMATVITVYGLASVALYALMKDDDDYKQAPQWERDAYHLFKVPGSDLMFRIPRPFEVGLMATIMERAAEQMLDDEVHGGLFWERLVHGVTETLAFNPIPQIIAPAMEVAANKSQFTQRPIENVGMQNLSPENRKRAWTSETAIGMSKAMNTVLWEKAELSPVQVEHLVNGYLGWAGGFMLASTDLIYRGLTGAPEAPTRRVQDYIAVGRFARRGPQWSTQYTTQFYENLQDVTRAYNDIRYARQHNQLGKVEDLITDSKKKLAWRKTYNKAQRELSSINKSLNLVRDSDLSGADKRKKMDAMLIRKARITQTLVKRSQTDFR